MEHKYCVSFFKNLGNSTGHHVDACQQTLEIQARSKQHAIDEACRRFAEQRHIGGWSLMADRVTAARVKTGTATASGQLPRH